MFDIRDALGRLNAVDRLVAAGDTEIAGRELTALMNDCAAAGANGPAVFVLSQIAQRTGAPEMAGELLTRAAALDPTFGPTMFALADHRLPGEDYYKVLKRFHDLLRPTLYLETGVGLGRSLRLCQPATRGIGIDPAPKLEAEPLPNTQVFLEMSDDFFARDDLAQILGGPIDLAFIDGAHTFRNALRDFIAVEPLMAPNGVILIHDCLPLDAFTATVERQSNFWSGDVWRLMPCLRRARPDLTISTIATAPTGLGMIYGFDAGSTVLTDRYDDLVAEYEALGFPEDETYKRDLVAARPNDWAAVAQELSRRTSH